MPSRQIEIGQDLRFLIYLPAGRQAIYEVKVRRADAREPSGEQN